MFRGFLCQLLKQGIEPFCGYLVTKPPNCTRTRVGCQLAAKVRVLN